MKQKYKRGPGLGGDADGPAVKRARGTEEATTSDDIIRVYGSVEVLPVIIDVDYDDCTFH